MAKRRVNWWRWPQARAQVGDAVAVLGGGLAGCWAARSLAEAGLRVTLFEANAELARGGSGNPAAVLYPMLSAEPALLPRFWETAFCHSLERLEQLRAEGHDFGWRAGGLYQMPTRRPEQAKRAFAREGWLHELGSYMAADEAQRSLGVRCDSDMIFFHKGGTLRPRELCFALVKHPGIQVACQTRVARLEAEASNWAVWDTSGAVRGLFRAVVVANAAAAMALGPCQWLPLTQSQGQICLLPANQLGQLGGAPRCGEAYWIPAENLDSFHLLGASYRRELCQLELDPAEQHAILKRAENLPGFELNCPPEALAANGRVSFRCETLDHAPLIGPVVDAARFICDFEGLRQGDQRANYPPPTYLPGLYLSVGHGSRGTLSCPLAASWLSALILGRREEWPDEEFQRLVHPSRFLLKALKQGES